MTWNFRNTTGARPAALRPPSFVAVTFTLTAGALALTAGALALTAGTLALTAVLGQATAHAADCPTDLATAGKLVLIDDKGKKLGVENLPDGLIRRTETTNAPDGEQVALSLEGLFPQTITTSAGGKRYTTRNLYSDGDKALQRQFLPARVGSKVTLDFQRLTVADGAPADPAPRPVRLRAAWKITAEEVITVGTCTYTTLVLENTYTSADGATTNTIVANHVPKLKTWLKWRGVFKTPNKPDMVSGATIVSLMVDK